MKKYRLPFLIFLLAIGVFLLLFSWAYWPHDDYEMGSDFRGMFILVLTFIAILAYTYYNYQLLNIHYKPFGKLNMRQNIVYIKEKRMKIKGDLRVVVSNECRIPLKAKLNLNPTVYSKPVQLPPDFATYFGEEYWELAPGMGIDGHIEVFDILKAAGKDYRKIKDEYSPQNANKQLRLEAEIIFEDYEDKYNIFNPKIKQKWIYNFDREIWIYEVAEIPINENNSV